MKVNFTSIFFVIILGTTVDVCATVMCSQAQRDGAEYNVGAYMGEKLKKCEIILANIFSFFLFISRGGLLLSSSNMKKKGRRKRSSI